MGPGGAREALEGLYGIRRSWIGPGRTAQDQEELDGPWKDYGRTRRSWIGPGRTAWDQEERDGPWKDYLGTRRSWIGPGKTA